jgi:hypothetical protein
LINKVNIYKLLAAIIDPEVVFGRRPTKKPLPGQEKKRRAGHTILSLPAGPGGS